MKIYFKLLASTIAISAAIGCAVAPSSKPSSRLQGKRTTSLEKTVTSFLPRLDKICPGSSISVDYKGEKVNVFSGLRDYDAGRNVTSRTQFPVGSVSKPITASAIHFLADQGKLDINEPITKYISTLPGDWQDISIFQLLTHTSGLNNYNDPGVLNDEIIENGWSKAEALETIVKQGRFSPAGSLFRYSNSNYFLLGLIIEQASGNSYPNFMTNFLRQQGKMTSSYYPQKSDLQKYNVAKGYRGPYQAGQTLQRSLDYNPIMAYSAGAIVSKGSDLIAFMSNIVEPRLQRPDSPYLRKAQLKLPNAQNIFSTYTAGGWLDRDFFNHRKVSHSGQIWGFNSQLALYPDNNLKVAILCNHMDPKENLITIESQLSKKILKIKDDTSRNLVATDSLNGDYVLSPVRFFNFDSASIKKSSENTLTLSLKQSNIPQAVWPMTFRKVAPGSYVGAHDVEARLQTTSYGEVVQLVLFGGELFLTKSETRFCKGLKESLSNILNSEKYKNSSVHVSSKNQQLNCQFNRGMANSKEKMTLQHGFRSASTGKMFTSATILKLVEQGRINLDDGIDKYLTFPSFKVQDLHIVEKEGRVKKYGDKIKVRHLLNHSSGLSDYIFDNPQFITDAMAAPSPIGWRGQWTGQKIMEEFVKAGMNKKTYNLPGEGFHYTDTNFALLAMIIESVTGQKYHDAVRKIVFNPLGMKETYLEWHEKPLDYLKVSHAFYGPNSAMSIDTSFDWGGGGFMTTHDDIGRFLKGLFHGEFFKDPSFIKLMTDSRAPGSKSYGFGIGEIKAKTATYYGHGGTWGSTSVYSPSIGTYISFILNQADKSEDGPVVKTIVDEIDSFLER